MSKIPFCLFLLSLILFSACQEQSVTPNYNSCDGYCVHTVGSYWIYQNVLIDSNNVERILPIEDTISIIGDTVINNHTYAILKGILIPYLPHQTPNIIGYVRDSLHYLIDEKGNILFSSQDFNSILAEHSFTRVENNNTYTNTYRYKMEDIVDSLTVPVGTFKVLNVQEIAVSTNPIENAVFSFKNRAQYYASGVGKVLQTYVLSEKRYIERRLLEYHIE